MTSSKDSIYANPLGEVATFEFDQNVASVFTDMIERSVPGYSTIIAAIGLLAERYQQPGSRCYDLGCSLGAATLAMHRQVTADDCQIIAVDNSLAMVESCRQAIDAQKASSNIKLICADIRDVVIENAAVVVLNFTLQFIPVADRLAFLAKIYQGLRPGGILVLSEKLQFSDPRQQVIQAEMHRAFKKANGYSELEISQKRTALENILIPETLGQHQQRLAAAGFDNSEVWFQYFNFASMLALK